MKWFRGGSAGDWKFPQQGARGTTTHTLCSLSFALWSLSLSLGKTL